MECSAQTGKFAAGAGQFAPQRPQGDGVGLHRAAQNPIFDLVNLIAQNFKAGFHHLGETFDQPHESFRRGCESVARVSLAPNIVDDP